MFLQELNAHHHENIIRLLNVLKADNDKVRIGTAMRGGLHHHGAGVGRSQCWRCWVIVLTVIAVHRLRLLCASDVCANLHLQFLQDIYLVFEYMEVRGTILAAAASPLSLWRVAHAGPGSGREWTGC